MRNCSAYVTGATYRIFFLFTGETTELGPIEERINKSNSRH